VEGDRTLLAVREPGIPGRHVQDKVTESGNDLSGEPTGEPALSAALGARYAWTLDGAGNLDLSGRYAYRGAGRCNADSQVQGSCASLTPFEVNAATQHLDLRLGWNSAVTSSASRPT
jgi:iron complex outermembrane receptor protein